MTSIKPLRIRIGDRLYKTADKNLIKSFYSKFVENHPRALTQIRIFKILLESHEKNIYLTNAISSDLIAKKVIESFKKDSSGREIPKYESIRGIIKDLKGNIEKLCREYSDIGGDLELLSTPFFKVNEDFPDKNIDTYLFVVPILPTKMPIRPREEDVKTWTNLKDRCKSYNQAIIGQLRYTYSPDLYIPRRKTEETFQDFLKSNKNLLLIVGSSGIGKTNLLCRLAETTEHPSLFFTGESYRHNRFCIREEIKKILGNLEILKSSDPVSGVDNLAQSVGELFLILIDDLNSFSKRASVWEEMTKLIVDCSVTCPHLRFCVSCRTKIWEALKREENILVPINQMYIPRTEDPLTFRSEEIEGVKLEGFEDAEIDAAIKRYQEVFNTKGQLGPTAHEMCADPLFLKLIFETYKNTDLPFDILKINVFDLFWDRIINRGGEGRREFIEGLVRYFEYQKKTSALLESIKAEHWFHSVALEKLTEEGVLTFIYKDRYEVTVSLFHDHFLEYVLARLFYKEKEKIYQNMLGYLNESMQFEPIKGGLKFFLDMLEENEKHQLFLFLSNTEEGKQFVCEYISNLGRIDDQNFEIFSNYFLELSYPSGFYLVNVGKQYPDDSISLAYNILKNYPEDEHFILSYSYFLVTICQKYPEYVQKIEEWLKSPAPIIQAVAVETIFRYLASTNSTKALEFFDECVQNNNIFIRRQMASALEFSTLSYDEYFLSLVEKLCEDEDKIVREKCGRSLANLITIQQDLIDYIEKWSQNQDVKVRETVAWTVGIRYVPGLRNILKLIKRLSQDKDDNVRICLVHALIGPGLIGRYSAYLIEQDSKNIFPIVEQIILKGSNQLREKLGSCFSGEIFNEIISKWSNSPQWQCRHMAIIARDMHPEMIDPFIKRKLSEDSYPEIRKHLALSLRFYNEQQDLLDEHIILLRKLVKDLDANVRLAALSTILLFASVRPDTVREILLNYMTSDSPLSHKLSFGMDMFVYYNESNEDKVDQLFQELIVEGNPSNYEILIPSVMFVLPKKVPTQICSEILEKLFLAPRWKTRALSLRYFKYSFSWDINQEKPPISFNILKKLCHDNSRIVRRELAETLSFLLLWDKRLYPKIWPLLCNLYEDPDWWVRVISTFCLRLPLTQNPSKNILGNHLEEAMAVLRKQSVDEDWGVRASSLLALSSSKEKEAKSLFRQFRDDEHSQVRRWFNLLNKTPLTDQLIYEFYAEMLCRDLDHFREEIEYDMVATDPKHPREVSEFIITPMFRFNKEKILDLLTHWKTDKDPFFQDVASHILSKSLS